MTLDTDREDILLLCLAVEQLRDKIRERGVPPPSQREPPTEVAKQLRKLSRLHAMLKEAHRIG